MNRSDPMRPTTLLLVLLALGGCALTPGRTVEVPGQIMTIGSPPRDTAEVAIPSQVSGGEGFEVTVLTFGGGCIRDPSRTRTVVAPLGLTAEITPYDRRTVSRVCTSDLLYLEHTAELRFEAPGTAVVTIRGAANDLQFGGEPEWATLEYTVEVVQ